MTQVPADQPEVEQAPCLCPKCHGAGTLMMSLCCGRGCSTCPGDGMFSQVECHRCRGAGSIDPPAPQP